MSMGAAEPDLSEFFGAGADEGEAPSPVEEPGIFEKEDGAKDDGFGPDDDGPKETLPKEKTPSVQRHGPRKSLSRLFSMAWGGVGTFLERTEIDYAVGRVMQFQAPLAGDRFEELVMHTWLDNLLQPLADSFDKAEGFGVVVGLPVLVALWERNPAGAPVLEALIAEAIESTLADLVPVLKEKNKKKQQAARVLNDLDDLGIPKGVDPAQFVMMQLLTPPGQRNGAEEAPPE